MKDWNGHKKLAQKEARENGMKGREKMDREELMRELEDMFRDEPDNNKLNAVLDLADAYAEHEYEKRKSLKSTVGKRCVCCGRRECRRTSGEGVHFYFREVRG